MSRGWEYRSGDWWITCDVCSKQIYASQSRKRWDGFIVCKEDWEPRHPQDFLKARLDKISVPFSRPQTIDIFNEVIGFIDFWEVTDDFQTIRNYSRDYTDSVEILDSTLQLNFGKSLEDTVTVADGLSLISSAALGLTDTVSVSSSGDLLSFDYVDATYVGLDYVGTSIGTIT